MPALPHRPIRRALSGVSREDLLGAIASQPTPSAIAFALRVDLLELNEALAEDDELKTALRRARAAAREIADTRIALAAPFAAGELEAMMQKSTPADSVRQGACSTILNLDKAVRKNDVLATPPKAMRWPGPGEPPVMVIKSTQEVEALLYPDDEPDGE